MRKDFFRKGMVLGIIILFVGAGFVPSISSESWQTKTTYGETQRASSINVRTIIVDDEGDGNTTTVQGAIDIADEGDIIKVYSGTYVESVIVDKQLTIIGIDEELGIGDDTGKPIIDGGGNGDVVYISSDKIEFNGFYIQNSGEKGGFISGDAGVEIHSNHNLIYNNDFLNNLDDLTLHSSSYNIIFNNTYTNSKWDGIWLDNSYNNNIYENIFINSGIGLYYNNHKNTFSNNSVNGKPLIYLEGISNMVIEEDAGQIVLLNCENITIQNQEITNTSHGVELIGSKNCLIQNNNISYNGPNGIVLVNSSENTILNNIISDSRWVGIDLFESSNNRISGNNIINNSYDGIFIRDNLCINNIIWYNVFLGNEKINAYSEIGASNQWDNGSVGNYWSNQHYRFDNNNDCISEIPCYILVSGVDWHPLMPCHAMVRTVIPPPSELPEILEIEMPKEGYFHIDNEAKYETPGGKTVLITFPWLDPLTMMVRVDSYYPIDEVAAIVDFNPEFPWKDEFELNNIIGSNQYQGKLTKLLIGTHTLTFFAYDLYGYSSEPVEMEIMCFYFPRPTIID